MTAEAMHIDQLLIEHYPDFSRELRKEISHEATIRKVESGQTLINIGNYIKSAALVFEGTIKVFRETTSGHEMFLYYLYPGQACAITFACVASALRSNIRAIAMKDTQFIAIPIAIVDDWMSKHKTWNHFVISTFRTRLEEMLETIDQVVFQKMDERLIGHLFRTAKAQESSVIKTSHQEIANELNSSREVISRLLKKMENEGQIKIHRGRIDLTGLSMQSGSLD